jgi:hypothetical protein
MTHNLPFNGKLALAVLLVDMVVNSVQLFEVLLYLKHSEKVKDPIQPPQIMGWPDTTAPVA